MAETAPPTAGTTTITMSGASERSSKRRSRPPPTRQADGMIHSAQSRSPKNLSALVCRHRNANPRSIGRKCKDIGSSPSGRTHPNHDSGRPIE
eukprot:6082173-Prymnesium_polylepis.1